MKRVKRAIGCAVVLAVGGVVVLAWYIRHGKVPPAPSREEDSSRWLH